MLIEYLVFIVLLAILAVSSVMVNKHKDDADKTSLGVAAGSLAISGTGIIYLAYRIFGLKKVSRTELIDEAVLRDFFNL